MKKVRIINRKRFNLSVSMFLVLIISFSMIAVSSLNAEGETTKKCITISVNQGDTIWSIAKLHGTEDMDIREVIYDIQMENQLASAIIHPGQEIRVPIY